METTQLLLTVGLSLLTVVGAAASPPLTPASADKLLGRWYIIRWAGNMPIPAKKKTSWLPPFTFIRNDLSRLEFRASIMKPIGCVLFKLTLDELEEPGIFHIWSGHFITIRFLLGEDLAIAYYKGTMDKTIYKMMMLMGRTPVENPRSLEFFKEFVENQGLNSSAIISPALDDRCL